MPSPPYMPEQWRDPALDAPSLPVRQSPPQQAAPETTPERPAAHTLDCSVEEFILRRLKSCELDGGELEEEARVRVIIDNVLFYRGQHHLYATTDCRVQSVYEDDEDADSLQVHNWFGHIADGIAKEWEASKPRIEIRGRTRDYRLEGAADLAQALDAYTRRPHIKAHFRQSEAKFGLFCKVYYRRSVLVLDESDETATRRRVATSEPRRFYVGGVLRCAACRHEWAEDDDMEGAPLGEQLPDYEPCPACGGRAEELAPRFPFEREVEAEGEELVPVLRHESVNPLCVKGDPRARRFQDSDYLICDTLERRYKLEADHPEIDFDDVSVPTESELPARLRAMLELERTSSGMDVMSFGDPRASETKEDERLRVREFWMLRGMYAHKRARADEEICGVKFKAGQRIGDVLPQGVVARVVGDKKIAALRSESKNKRWCGSAFKLDPTTFHGKGMEDARSIQESIDDKATLAASHFDREGAPTEVFDTSIVDMDEFDGSTGKRVPTKDTIPDGKKASDAVHVVQGGQLGSDFQNFFQQEPIIMREIMGVSRGMVGQEDPNNRTARGQELAAAASASLVIPSLALRAEEVEPETTYQNLEYWHIYGADEDFELFESEFGTEAIETFRKLNLRRDLVVEAVPGSWVPQTKEQDIENCKEFAGTFLMAAAGGGGPEGQPIPSPMPMAFVRYAAGLYNIPASAFEPEADTKLAQTRVARLRQWAEKAVAAGAMELSPIAYEQMLERIMLEPDLTPHPLIENHPVHMEFLSGQWKQSFDDRKGNPVFLDLLVKMFEAHLMAQAKAQFKTQELLMKASAPQRAMDQVSQEVAGDEAAAVGEENAEAQAARDSQSADEEGRRQLALKAAEMELEPEPVQ